MIKLLPRKEFEITLESGEVVLGQFGTWALKRFCEKRGVQLSEVSKLFEAGSTIEIIIDYILSATEQSWKQLKKGTFIYDDVDVCKWFDEMGGFDSQDVIALMNHASENGVEKKSDQGSP